MGVVRKFGERAWGSVGGVVGKVSGECGEGV